jgi:putative ABC transport system substrate-binding protein
MQSRGFSPQRRRWLGAALAGCATRAVAQAPAKGPARRLGILAVGPRAVELRNWEPMLAMLAKLGYSEGSNLVLDWRFAESSPERLADLARDLVRARVDAAATMGSAATRALQQATQTIPIVTGAVGDPILGGFAQSLARPGGNITGLSMGGTEIAQLQVSLLRSIVPKLTRLVIVRGGGESEQEVVGPMAAAAKAAQLTPGPVVVRDSASLESAFRSVRPPGTGAAFVYDADRVEAEQLAEAALRYKVATMFPDRRWVSAGGLMSYSMYHEDRMRRIATTLDKVLRGTNPAECPFELPANSHFALNLRTATALGIAIPPAFLARVDEVIE